MLTARWDGPHVLFGRLLSGLSLDHQQDARADHQDAADHVEHGGADAAGAGKNGAFFVDDLSRLLQIFRSIIVLGNSEILIRSFVIAIRNGFFNQCIGSICKTGKDGTAPSSSDLYSVASSMLSTQDTTLSSILYNTCLHRS